MRRWQALALAVSSITVLGAGACWRATALHDALFERVERRLEGNAASIETAVERWIEERRYDAATVAGEVASTLPADGTPPSAQSFSLLLRRMLDGHGYLNVWVLDSTGRLLGAATPGTPDAAEARAAVASARTGRAKTCAPFIRADGHATLCYAASPVAAGGSTAGLSDSGPARFVIVLRADPYGSLLPLLASAAAAGGSERGRLVGRMGDVLGVLAGTEREAGRRAQMSIPWRSAPDVLRRAIDGQVAHGHYTDFDGHEVIAGARPVRGTEWAVVRQVDRAEIERVYRAELRTEAMLAAAVLLALGIGVASVSRSERTRRLRDVAASEARLVDTLRWSLDAVIAFDDTARIRFFNAAAERTFGYRAEEVLGESLTVLAPPEMRDQQIATLRSYLAEPVPSVEFAAEAMAKARRADGEVFPVEGVLTMGQAGEQRLFTLMVRDITERVRHQQEREESLSLLRATLESTADGILVVDVSGRTTAFNRKFLELWGIPEAMASSGDRQALLDLTCQRVRDPQAFVSRVLALSADPVADSYDLLEMSDGRTVERVSRPQRIGDRVVGRVWSFRDVTAREVAASALRRSEASARAFVDRSPYGICRVTADGLFMSANPALVAMLGYRSEEALLRVDLGTLYVDASVRAGIMRRHEAGEDSAVAETRWHRPDGVELPIRISSQLVRDTRGQCMHYLAYVENLAPLRSAEQALRQAEKLAAVGQFVSGVAHELNNPLAAVLLFAESLLEETTLDHERETLSLLREQACRARAIVRDLLSFVRGAHGTAATVSTRDLLGQLVPSLQRQALAAGGRLDLVADGDLGWIHADRGAIEQVLTNLLVNALHAAPNGPVTLCASRDAASQHVRLVVEDDGPGIPIEALPRVFEPFFTTKPVGVGTGLGLSVSLGIAEQHGGTLHAENRLPTEGCGARLTLSLPLVAAPPLIAPPPPDEARNDEAPTPPRRVLVVDDEAAIRRALARFFVRRSWQVDEAADGGEALDRLLDDVATGQRRYDLVISDLRMPGVSGVVLHDRLAEAYPEMLGRVVFSTGDVVSPEAAAFVARTGCEVIEKPFHFSALDTLVSRVTGPRLVAA